MENERKSTKKKTETKTTKKPDTTKKTTTAGNKKTTTKETKKVTITKKEEIEEASEENTGKTISFSLGVAVIVVLVLIGSIILGIAISSKNNKDGNSNENNGSKGNSSSNFSSLNIGDYVSYTPKTDSTTYSLNSVYSGYSQERIINQDSELKWRVFSINNDGSISLISAKPTAQKVTLNGAAGYNNGVFLLNDICNQLYSNKEIGAVARSISYEDVLSKMQSTEINEPTVITYNSPFNRYPIIYRYEKGSATEGSAILTEGIEMSDNYYSVATTDSDTGSELPLTCTQNLQIIGNPSRLFQDQSMYTTLFNTDFKYWMATRGVYPSEEKAYFTIRTISEGTFDLKAIYVSDGTFSDLESYLRPIVTISAYSYKRGAGTESDPKVIY